VIDRNRQHTDRHTETLRDTETHTETHTDRQTDGNTHIQIKTHHVTRLLLWRGAQQQEEPEPGNSAEEQNAVKLLGLVLCVE
jgi:hypothetical protein